MSADFRDWLLCLMAFITFGTAAEAGPLHSANQSPEHPESVAVNAGISLANPYSLFGYLSALVAPSGDLDQSGFRWRLSTVDGQFSYPEEDIGARVFGLSKEASLLVGYSFNQANANLLLMGGATVQNISLSIPDPTNPAQSTAFGAKGSVEFDTNPTKNTKVELEAQYSTVFKAYFVRFGTGYAALGPEVFLGPELTLLGDERYQQWRLGASLSGFKVGRVDVGVSAGYLRDKQQGGGAYGGVDLYFRY